MARILMVCSEATPFAKTGGLADVVGALPAALTGIGEEVAVVMPRYGRIPWDSTESAYDNLRLFAGPHPWNVDIRTRVEKGVRFYFVEHPVLFDREGLYSQRSFDYWDNHRRFAVLALAALGVAQTLFKPDIIHCHDWQTGLVPVYRHDQQWSNPAFHDVRTVFTIHNLGYHGRFSANLLPDLGLNAGWMTPDKLEYYGDISYLKAGITMSDWVTTVSPAYAREIQTPEGGFGFDGIMRSVSGHLSGILNGVDYSEWSPEIDPLIPAQFSAADLAGKRACKKALLDEFHLSSDNLDRPLIGIVSRFAGQKGFDLIAGLSHYFSHQDVQLVVLGSGETRYENLFNDWHRWLPEKVGVWIGYNNALAHRIEAGADMFLMPSLYEPCGLNQIYSLRYGTVPVVRATGGLDDTIQKETGFKFHEYSVPALEAVLDEALAAFRNHRNWVARMKRGMAKDFSWAASARQYSELYAQLAARG
ncbi:MAG TPA: glycogen synthase GlgA [Bryobacteraceae bacterium]|nr:glycogen synthase GlgA [Bryobacteraceae bacterium]